MAESIVSWLSLFLVSIPGILMGIFIYIKKDSFRTGKMEATAAGKTELNSTLLNNAIKEIELAKAEISKLSLHVSDQTINVVRLEERLKYILERLDALAGDVKSMINTESKHYKERWEYNPRKDSNDQ